MNPHIYKITFQANGNTGDGIVVVSESTFLGGDSCLYYAGTIVQQGSVISITLQTRRHSSGGASILDKDEFEGTLTGTATEAGFTVANETLVIVGTLLPVITMPT
jgi:hypothetical protein